SRICTVSLPLRRCLTILCLSYLIRHPPRTPLFPYTTLFRSDQTPDGHGRGPDLCRPDGGRPVRDSLSVSAAPYPPRQSRQQKQTDRKSTRLNSSHVSISYAVFCLKKKNKPQTTQAS